MRIELNYVKRTTPNYSVEKLLTGEGTDPEMMDILQKYIFGEVFRTGDLDMKTREMITCVSLAAMQQLPQLKSHAGAALNVGVTPIELREAIYQCAPIIGFPKVLNALSAINSTFTERGIKLPLEKQETVTEKNRLEKGLAIQEATLRRGHEGIPERCSGRHGSRRSTFPDRSSLRRFPNPKRTEYPNT